MIENSYKPHGFKRFVLFVLLLLIVLEGFAYLLINHHSLKKLYESPEYPMWKQTEAAIKNSSNKHFDLVVIGDSRAKAGFIPADETMINFSLGGSTAIEGYYTLKRLIDNNAVINNLVLSYSPYHLMRPEVFWERTVNYQYIDYKTYQTIRNKAFELHGETKHPYGPLGVEDLWWSYRFLLGMQFHNIKHGLLMDYPDYQEVYDVVEQQGGQYFFGRDNGSSLVNLEAGRKNFWRPKLLDYYLVETIQLAKEHNINVYWYTMPFNQASCDHLKPKFKQSFLGYLHQLENIEVLQDIACWPNALFGDADHLYLGAKKASDQIVQAVKLSR